MVTRPVTALAEGTQAISAGKLDYRVKVSAGDELGQLVGSFNSMAAELESNRSQLQEANVRLEERRLQMETILESIPSGVLSMDGAGQVTRVNAALIRMFQPPGVTQPGPQTGLRLTDLFPAGSAPEVAEEIRRLTRKADRMGTTTSQMEIPNRGTALEVGVTVASMTGSQQRRLGYVIVFEDLSDLLKAQKQAAWREVARRVAHEIKNPLTPIALSAERIKRHIERGMRGESISRAIIESCADTISGAVETVRRLVDEFATLARFPQSQPQPSDLNRIILSAMALFEGRLGGVNVQTGAGRRPAARDGRSGGDQAGGGQPGGQRGREPEGFGGARDSHQHHSAGDARRGGDRGQRHRRGSDGGDERETLPAVLLNQGARNGTGTGDCGANSGRSRRHGAGGGESSGGHALSGGVARGRRRASRDTAAVGRDARRSLKQKKGER